MLVLGDHPLQPRRLVAAACGTEPVRFSERAAARIAEGHAAFLRAAAGGGAIYGTSTGLGAVADTAVAASSPAVQRRIVLGRMVGVGERAGPAQVRAAMIARLSRLGTGASGIAPATADAYLAMLNAGILPAMPLLGSVGEADLAPLAHVAGALLGAGEVALAGECLPAAEALARAGIVAPTLGPRDGLALVSSNAASVGLAALAVDAAERGFGGLLAAASLSLEAYRGSLAPLDPAVASLRPAPGQAEVASRLLAILEGGALREPGAARKLQDPLSFRCLAPVLGAALDALRRANDAVALELASADDNPAVILPEGTIQATANFDPTHMVLALETLGLALARVAALSYGRIVQLMSARSSGLPRFLAPVEDGRSGLAPVQKTALSLLAEIGRESVPIPASLPAAADGVEDATSMAVSVALKLGRLVARLDLLSATELLVAAQAADLRAAPGIAPAVAAIHAAVRARAPRLEEDRPAAPDIAALGALVMEGAFLPLAMKLLGPEARG